MTKDELKLLLSLNGGQRIFHLEQEIFASRSLSNTYLNTLCSQYQWYRPGTSNDWLVYFYARNVIKWRWPEAEFLILRHHPGEPISLYYRELYDTPF